ncbi:MAG: TldD/PmbA family protein [Deferribacterales bacterium]
MNGKISDALLYDIVTGLSRFGQYSEVFMEDTKKLSAVYENSVLDRLENGSESGLSIRLIDGDRTYFAYTCDMSEKSLRETYAALISSLKVKDTSEVRFERPVSLSSYITRSDRQTEEKIRIVAEMDKAARCDKRIIQATSSYLESHRHTRIINSLGLDVSQKLNYVTAYTIAAASDGNTVQSAYIPVGGVFGLEESAGMDCISAARESGELAVRNLTAKNAPAGTMPVVLASDAGGTMVHEAVGHGLEADLACNGMSVYADRLGQRVASDLITVVDDPTLKTRRGNFIYDDEGTLAKENILIENGVLKNYMFDRLYGYKENTASTGNGRRQSFRHRPIVRMSNTYIRPGASSPEEIISSTRNGLYVKLMGGGQVNTVTGDFVFEVTEGCLIENGKIGEPVRNATLIGNGPQIMSEIDMVGTDLGFGMGTCGKEGQGVPVSDAQPTLRIPSITVGGM